MSVELGDCPLLGCGFCSSEVVHEMAGIMDDEVDVVELAGECG